MGYILVYEELRGAKLRGLRKQLRFCESDTIGILVELWLFAKRNARPDGLLVNTEISDLIFEFESVIRSNVSPEFVVDGLLESGWLEKREDGLYVHDWAKWQEHMYSHERQKERQRERKRKERERKDEHTVHQVQQSPESNTPQMTLFAQGKLKKEQSDETRFEEAWKAYPRKKDKALARKAYIARINDGYSPDELVSASKAYAQECAGDRREERFIKLGATFFGPSTPFADYLKQDQTDEDDSDDITRYYL